MTKFSLPQSGSDAVEFEGKLLFAASDNDSDGSSQGRRHELCIYHTDDDRFVVSIAYRSPIESEVPDDYVEIAQSSAELEEVLSLYDPVGHVDQNTFVETQARQKATVLQTLTRRYDQLVAQILQAADAAHQPTNRT